MAEATLSSRNRIVVPRDAREALGVHPGDKLLIVVRGNTVTILPKPRSWTEALRGLANQPYPEGYLDEERDSWDWLPFALSSEGIAGSILAAG